MNDTFITVIAIFLAAVLLFVLPVLTMADRLDDVSKTNVDTITSDFISEIQMTGKLTLKDYTSYIEKLTATGNTYDVNMEIKILDENPGKKASQSEKDKIGENVYYSIYTTQIQDILDDDNNNNQYTLKEGDIVKVTVKNTNLTLGQQMKNWFYTILGNDTYTVSASESAMVTTNGGDLVYTAENSEDGNNNENENDIIYVLRENDASGKILSAKDWTNQNIYVELKSKDAYQLGLDFYWKYSTETEYHKCDGNSVIIQNGSPIDVYWKHTDLEKYSVVETININIEKTIPEIGEVIGSSTINNYGTITLNNISDNGGSGLNSYYISNKPTTPSVNDIGWTYNTANSVTKIVYENGTYYAWVKDNAGNISERKSCVVSEIVPPIEKVELKNNIVKKAGNVTMIPQFTGGNLYKDIKFTSANTNIATINNNGIATGIDAGMTPITCVVTNYNGTTVSTNAMLTAVDIKSYNPDGETTDLPYENGKFGTLNKTVVATILGATKQEYTWSTSNITTPTSSWSAYGDGGQAILRTSEAGTYYLWSRLTDAYGNNTIYVSNPYKVIKNKIKVIEEYLINHNAQNLYNITNDITNPTGWTNQDVTITVNLNVPDELKEAVDGLIIQTSNDGINWDNTNIQKLEQNGIIYIRLNDDETNTQTAYATYNLTVIDKIPPIINSLTPNTTSMTYGSITLTGKATDGNSGINYYQFSTSATPSSNNWTTITRTTSQIAKTYSATSNGTYYFHVKDAAENVTTAYITISNLCTNHTYTNAITTSPTCTTTGVRTYTCTNCGDTYTETISASGHNYVAQDVGIAPQLDNGGPQSPCSQHKNCVIVNWSIYFGCCKSWKSVTIHSSWGWSPSDVWAGAHGGTTCRIYVCSLCGAH